jgi:hypothetical protein
VDQSHSKEKTTYCFTELACDAALFSAGVSAQGMLAAESGRDRTLSVLSAPCTSPKQEPIFVVHDWGCTKIDHIGGRADDAPSRKGSKSCTYDEDISHSLAEHCCADSVQHERIKHTVV